MFEDITPDWQMDDKAAPASAQARRASTLPAVFLAPWEFRVFSRRVP
jgi:hypothetical protein